MIEITSITAVWFHTRQTPLPIRWVIVRDSKQMVKTQALLCTDLSISPEQIVQWFVRRWQVEVTFHEVRTHLGVETQRQWADLTIAHHAFLVGIIFHCYFAGQLPVEQTAWYPKKLPTFSDALALVKETLLIQHHFPTSLFRMHVRKTQRVWPIYRYSHSFHALSRVSFV